jgi:hypothetical protein
MPLILGANSVSGYTVKNSLRFNSGSSDYLSRTPAGAGNRQTFTWSAWVKRGNLSSAYGIFSAGQNNSNAIDAFEFNSSDQIRLYSYNAAYLFHYETTAVYRDPSAWYHIVVAIDTTQATASNRVKLYVNGQQVTVFSTQVDPTQNSNCNYFNTTNLHTIGATYNNTRFLSGYQSEINFINAQQLTPSSFGETDTLTGIWIPKAYTGTYGTNGFELEFKNSASLGTDTSGNGNNWTVNNLTSVDQSTDTPTNNFATFNALRSTGGLVDFTEGNLKATALTDATTFFHTAYSSIGVTKGKWYAEFKCAVGGNPSNNIIVAGGSLEYSQDSGNQNGSAVGITSYNGLGSFAVDGTSSSGLTTYTAGDIIGVYLNVDDSQISFYKNGSQVSTTRTLTTTASSGITYFIAIVRNLDGFSSWEANFGSPPFTIASGNADANGYGNFEYAVPSGYYALCTKNLANFG